MLKSKEKEWSFFLEKILEIFEKDYSELENEGTEIDSAENKLLLNTITNLRISKYFYNRRYNKVEDNLQEMILNSQMRYQEALDNDFLRAVVER